MMKFRSATRGSALANVIFLCVALFGLLFATSSTSLFQMGFTAKSSAQAGSRRLAEATIQTAIARLLKQNNADLALTLTLPGYPDGVGLLHMDSGTANGLGIEDSANNLTGTTNKSARGGRVTVAPERACLVGVGRYRGAETRLEVMLHVPEFPYVLGTSVPLIGQDLKVFSVASRSELVNGIDLIPDSKKEPGHLVTNAFDSGSGSALQLLGGTIVEGDAQSRGGIVVGGPLTVKGEQRPQAEPVPLPKINIASLDTATQPANPLAAGSLANPPAFVGFYRCPGALSVTGGMELNGAVIYVDGPVTVDGGLKGQGALISTGSVTVRGGSAFTGDTDQSGIVAQGDITIDGNGSTSEFRGLLYTEGNLRCLDTRVAGSAVANSVSGASAALTQTTLVQTPGMSTLAFTITTTVPGGPPSLQQVTDFGYHAYAWGALFDVNSGADWMDIKMKWDPMDYENPDTSLFTITHPRTAAEPWLEIGPPATPPADLIQYGKMRIGVCGPNTGALISGSWREERDRASASSAILAEANSWSGGAINQGMVDSFLDGAEQKVTDLLPEYIRVFNENSRYLGQNGIVINPGSTSYTRVVPWSLKLSQFYNLSERIRMLSWREI